MSLSKRRSSSLGNKARLAASHQSASGPVSSALAVSRVMGTASSAQHAVKVFSVVERCFSVAVNLFLSSS